MQKLRNLAILCLCALAASASAQVVPSPVQYLVAPETPGPGETVVIEAQGVGSFLGEANFSWTRDGSVIASGVGERSVTFATGALGVRTVIRVTITSSQGTFTESFVFTPSKINLVWEADTTAPPLFWGKRLYSGGSSYKVVAYPTVFSGTARILSSALSFQWTVAGEPVPEHSGLGRSVLSRTGDQLQAGEEVVVEVYYGTAKVGRGELFVPAADPVILFYERDALRGTLYERALPGGIALAGQEITLQAEPYFFSTAAKNSGNIPFVWTLGGEPVEGPDAARGALTLRQTGSGEGETELGVSIQNAVPDQFVQSASQVLRLVFGGPQNNPLLNLFGL